MKANALWYAQVYGYWCLWGKWFRFGRLRGEPEAYWRPKKPGLSDSVSKIMGKWSSVAWFNYHFTCQFDLLVAARSIWESTASSPKSLVVGSFSPAGIFCDEEEV